MVARVATYVPLSCLISVPSGGLELAVGAAGCIQTRPASRGAATLPFPVPEPATA